MAAIAAASAEIVSERSSITGAGRVTQPVIDRRRTLAGEYGQQQNGGENHQQNNVQPAHHAPPRRKEIRASGQVGTSNREGKAMSLEGQP